MRISLYPTSVLGKSQMNAVIELNHFAGGLGEAALMNFTPYSEKQ